LLELDADALDVGRALVAVPGDALDADLGDHSPKTAVAVDKRRAHALTRRADGRRQTAGTAADDHNVGVAQDRSRSRRLFDMSHATSARLDGEA